ncbi:hypothetical protein [Sphingomonas sp. SUN039]|uniref:hypothetical protein n=1 Tax=Sphingomonas sp. SUN039 TaxID=2937787 RepID=UPI0021649540|nr:hypothetical protein [Sphingomonas sp. SUN039]UVO54722.1 hypothetical protein M0209_11530 [Sphingomonas sp. SUN039]
MPLAPLPTGTPTLSAIITAARAGSLDHARALFAAGDYGARTGDPGALAVKGRLLKDAALRLPPDAQGPAFAEAARAYAAADAMAPQPYTRINMATLTLLAGDGARAAMIARDLLGWLASGDAIAETPYYLAATRAEAHLLFGDVDAAEAALDEAYVADPDGWADHASTLAQLRLVLAARGESAMWLDRFRPPRSLHFAGHLGVAPDSDLGARVDALIAEARIGFGYGALAAGADIVIAEALLAAGAELHVVLPVPADTFRAQSVAPYAPTWTRRFDACLDAATSVRELTRVSGDYEPLATALAADVAMGSAVLNARMLDSAAVQLLVVDEGPGPFGSGLGTARDGLRWARSGRSQHVVVHPRDAPVVASGARTAPEGRPDRRLAAMLHIAFAGLDTLDDSAFAATVDTMLTPFRERIASVDPQPDIVLPTGNARIVGFADPAAAWRFASALMSAHDGPLPLRIAGHYALAHWLDMPPALVGPGIVELERIAARAMPGVATVSETFASALSACDVADARAEWVGELGDGARLFALTPQ